MSIEYLTIYIFGFFLLMLAMGLPVVFSLGGIAVIATYFLWGPQAIHMMANRTFTGANSFVLLAIPMFIFMGCMLEKSGIARDLYCHDVQMDGAHKRRIGNRHCHHLRHFCRHGGNYRCGHGLHGNGGPPFYAQVQL